MTVISKLLQAIRRQKKFLMKKEINPIPNEFNKIFLSNIKSFPKEGK